MSKTTKTPSKPQSRSDAMKRAWATRRANAAPQADPAVEPVADTGVPAVETETDLPTEIGVVSENGAAVEAHPSVEPDLATQPEVASEPDVAREPALAPPPVPAAELDSTVQSVSTVVQPDSVAAWTKHPVCLCGCGEDLVLSKSEARQSLFKVGHDARLKSLAARVIKGTASRDEIPAIARALQERIGFLKTRPELAAAFQ
jgi:hypothetical protein